MCGIAGKASATESVDRGLIHDMCAAIEHRGPDSRGTFLDEGIGLGIQRLAIIDLQTGDQPIFNEDRSVVVVLNGEIYNYRELRAELETSGHRFGTHSDTEVIVHLYEDHGDRCVDHLRGMFAFALWDRRKRRLLLARDRVGKKPLFYALHNGEMWFGSEVRSILSDPAIPRDMDPDAVDAYMRYGYVPDPKSAFSALHKLPPAHVLSWQDGEVGISRYWRLSFAPDDHYGDRKEMEERVRAELLEATRLRMRSDVPLGAFLSGGVDSSAVVAAMAQFSSRPVRTFSIGFDVEGFDETAYAREIAQRFDTEHHEFHIKPDAMAILPKLVYQYGEPFADQAAIPSFYLSELTRRHVTVALTGDGGDESFAGYRHHANSVALERLSLVPSGLARIGAPAFAKLASGGRPGLTGRLGRAGYVLGFRTPAERYAASMRTFSARELDRLYTSEFRSSVASNGTAATAVTEPFLASDAGTHLERVLAADIGSLLPGKFLVKTDIASMAYSLEVRSPFLDHRFMEIVARLPAGAKLNGGTGKRILKDALLEWIPEHVLNRPKQGFAVPVSDWLRGPLRHLPEDILLDDRSLGRGIFQAERVRSLVDQHLSGKADRGDRVWRLLQLELWFRTFVDPTQPTTVVI